MIVLYTVALVFLGAVKFLIDRRVAALERKYLRTVDAADHLLREPAPRPNTSNRLELAQAAKHQLALGLLVERQDRLEAKYEDWQKFAHRFGTFVTRVRNWKGKKLPYTMGVIDVSLVLTAVDYLWAGSYVNVRNLYDLAGSLLSR
jgi:hypothetical protein